MAIERYLAKARKSVERHGTHQYLSTLLRFDCSKKDCVRIASYLRTERISNGKTPYLNRHRLAPDVYLHHFVASDVPGLFHNHPWDASASLILVAGYTEERLVSKTVYRNLYRVGQLNEIGPSDYHRIELTGEEAWTLFLAGKPTRRWGYVDREGNATEAQR